MIDISKKHIGVFFGGKSPEHDISIVTGLHVLEILASLNIKATAVYIGTDGAWSIGDDLHTKDFFKTVHTRDLYLYQRWSIDTTGRRSELVLTRRPHFFARRERVVFDIIFPALHGAFGEDGGFQGLCENLGVAYVGCDVATCAVAMDKAFTKDICRALDIPTPASVTVESTGGYDQSVEQKILTELTFPLFVKPAHAGSSIGITRVTKNEQLPAAVSLALNFDSKCVIENGVSPMKDLTCCVRQLASGAYEASLVQESTFLGSDFFTYEEKYIDDGGVQLGQAKKKIIIPAAIDTEIAETIKEISIELATYLGAVGIMRVDFLLNLDSKELFVNEINPMPGTLYTHLWKESGIAPDVLVTDLLNSAMAAFARRRKKSMYFTSDLLQAAGGSKGKITVDL